MDIKDYLKIQIKNPSLEPAEEFLESRKKAFQKSMKENYSKQESIELLYNNSKYSDAKILIQALHNDILNPILFLYDKQKAQVNLDEAFSLIKDSSISSTCKNEYNSIKEIIEIENFDATEVENALSSIQTIFNYFEKYFRLEKHKNFHTSNDDHKNRLLVQSAILGLLFVTTVFPLFYNRIKYPPIQNDNAFLFYKLSETESYSPQNSISLKLNKEGWQEYKFKLKSPETLFNLRLDPMNQSKIKLQLKEIRILDNSGKILKERDFRIGSDLRLQDFQEIESFQQLKPGKIESGKFIEMITTGSDPQISFNFGVLKAVAEIQVTYRVTRGNTKLID